LPRQDCYSVEIVSVSERSAEDMLAELLVLYAQEAAEEP